MSSPVAKKPKLNSSTKISITPTGTSTIVTTTVQLPSQPLPPSAALGSPPASTSTTASGASDQVQSAVMRYLQKRKYSSNMTEAYKRLNTSIHRSQPLVQSKAQLAVRELLRSEAGSTATVALSSPPNVDPLVIEQQYAKFKMWISESHDSYKPELAQLLYPMFTHLYLDLVLAGHKNIAQKFHKRHQSTFLGNPNFASFIRVLCNVQTLEDIQRDVSVTAFLTTKYSVTLSNKTFHYLMRYLQQQQSQNQPPVLLHVLHAKVDVRLLDALGAPSSKYEAVQRVLTEQQSSPADSDSSSSQSTHNTKYNKTTLDKTPSKSTTDELNGFITSPSRSISDPLKKIHDVIKAVREGPTPLPSSILYRVTNPYSNLQCATLSSDATMLITGCENASLISWDLLPRQPPLHNGYTNSEVTLNPSTIRLGCDDDNTLEDYELHDLKRKSILRGHNGPIYDVTFMPRSKYALSVSEDTTMRLWDLETGINKAMYQGHSYPIWSVDSDRVGINIATGSMDRTAKLWHMEYTHPLRVYAGHEQDVDVVKFHPNCNYIATGGSDKTIRLWSHSDANMVRVFSGHRGSILSLAFSPDGKYLASAGEDRRVKIWDLASSNLFKDFRGHNETIHSLTWSSDSNLLVSGGLDGIIKLWDVHKTDSEKSEHSIPTRCTNLLELCYSPHNTLVAIGVTKES